MNNIEKGLRLLVQGMENAQQAAPVAISSFARRLREEVTSRHDRVDAAVAALSVGIIAGACTVPESIGTTYPILLAASAAYGIHLHLRSHPRQ